MGHGGSLGGPEMPHDTKVWLKGFGVALLLAFGSFILYGMFGNPCGPS